MEATTTANTPRHTFPVHRAAERVLSARRSWQSVWHDSVSSFVAVLAAKSCKGVASAAHHLGGIRNAGAAPSYGVLRKGLRAAR